MWEAGEEAAFSGPDGHMRDNLLAPAIPGTVPASSVSVLLFVLDRFLVCNFSDEKTGSEELKRLAQGHTASAWQNRTLLPGLQNSKQTPHCRNCFRIQEKEGAHYCGFQTCLPVDSSLKCGSPAPSQNYSGNPI